MACGLTGNFAQILLARATVGVGEAALSPAAYSLISDIFPRERLGRATGLYSLGSFLGTTCAFLGGGWLIGRLGDHGHYLLFSHVFSSWQIIFMLVGLPGLPLAAAVFLFVAEPRRRGAVPGAEALATFKATFDYLRAEKGIFAPLLIGYPLYATALYVLLGWSPAFLIRSLGFTTSHAGAWLGASSLLAGGAGVLISGALTDRLISARRFAVPFEIGIAGAVGLGLAMLMLALAPVGAMSQSALALGLFFAAMPMAPSVTIIQIAVPPAMRSRVSAFLLLGNNLIGFTCGNFAVGWLNDHALGGPLGIRFSLPIVVGVAALMAVPFLIAGRRPLARLIQVASTAS
jgi:MFS family permease